MRSMWVFTGLWTTLVLGYLLLSPPYAHPLNAVTVADTWFKGLVVIAAFHILHALRRDERRETNSTKPERTEVSQKNGGH